MKLESLFNLGEHLDTLIRDGNPPEVFAKTVDLENVRNLLTRRLGYADDLKGSSPPFDSVCMFRILFLQSLHNLSDTRTEFMVRDRISRVRFSEF